MIFASDIKLYGKNCIVLFYKTFATQYSYTSIGHLKECEDLEDIVGKGGTAVKIYCE